MKKKTAGQICAEIFKEYNKKASTKYEFFDIGLMTMALDMYDALIENGFKGTRYKHPSSKINYVSELIASDCRRKDGYWICNEKMTYLGLVKVPVNVYRLRKRNE